MSGCDSESLTCCDLTKMSEKQLTELRTQIVVELDRRSEETENEFFKTAEFKALKKEYKALIKEHNSLGKTHTATVNIPLKLKIDLFPQELDYVLDGSRKPEIEDLWSVSATAKVLAVSTHDGVVIDKKGVALDKEGLRSLQEFVDNVMHDVCSDVLFLTPEVVETVKQFVGKVGDFHTRMNKTPACSADF